MKCVTFTVDQLLCGIPIDVVRETIDAQPVTPVPLAAAEIDGLMNLRGQIVMAIDLRRRLGLARRDDSCHRMNVVVDVGSGPVSLVVDEVDEVVDLDGPAQEPPSTLYHRLRQYVTSVHERDQRTLLVLDASEVVRIDTISRLDGAR
jgi:purine-binding chemotaxis protein CheW